MEEVHVRIGLDMVFFCDMISLMNLQIINGRRDVFKEVIENNLRQL